jgi:hypothetical protein
MATATPPTGSAALLEAIREATGIVAESVAQVESVVVAEWGVQVG